MISNTIVALDIVIYSEKLVVDLIAVYVYLIDEHLYCPVCCRSDRQRVHWFPPSVTHTDVHQYIRSRSKNIEIIVTLL